MKLNKYRKTHFSHTPLDLCHRPETLPSWVRPSRIVDVDEGRERQRVREGESSKVERDGTEVVDKGRLGRLCRRPGWYDLKVPGTLGNRQSRVYTRLESAGLFRL